MPVAWESIEPLLMQTAKPARYVGGEFNQSVKPRAKVRVCLAFPDLYEIGMSYHGYRLLYERINARKEWAAERAFTPWADFQKQLREKGIPLYSLETFRPLAEFHWIGFTLQHEVNFTNILTMLDLAGIPLESKDRTAAFPILIGGGEGAFSPEAVSPFLDAFVVGDGEEACLEITALIEQAIDEGWDRHAILRKLARIPGVYVPEFYDVEYNDDATIAKISVRVDLQDELAPPAVIHKRYFNVAEDYGSVRPVVPLVRTVHDRLAIEIRRGCVNGCRFCQAGMITRPVHERSVDQIVEIARQGIANTGYDEVSLLSLSSADYTMIAPLVARFNREFGERGVSVSLPSLRINGFDVKLVDEIAKVRKSGFTFAPEAGTTRLREVINKPVDQGRFFEIIEDVFRRGWRTVKFYFMIGLPTETREDLDGIVEICERTARLGQQIHGAKATVNVTLSPFVPKSNTPFQWEAQPPREELQERYHYLRHEIMRRCGKRVDVKTSDIGQSFIEACLARGDRRMAKVVRRAWELGAQFDGWDECFNVHTWLQAFEECGLDPNWYANRERGEKEIFPFEMIDSNVGRRFLWADQRRARMARWVEKCDTGKCAGCDVCNDIFDHTLAQDMEPVAEEDKNRSVSTNDMPLPKLAIPVANRAMEQVMAERDDLEIEDETDGDPDMEANDAPGEFEPALSIGGGQSSEAGDCEGAPAKLGRGVPPNKMPAPVQRIRLTYDRGGGLRYLSHLDFVKVMFMVLRRAGAPLAYTQGFNPMPRVQFAPPMSLGMAGEGELVDLLLTDWTAPSRLAEAMNAIGLAGLRIAEAEEVPLSEDAIEAQIAASRFRLEWTGEANAAMIEAFREKIEAFEAAEQFVIEVMKKDKPRRMDLKGSVFAVAMASDSARPVFHLTINQQPGSFVKPHDALAAILGRAAALGIDVRAARTGFEMKAGRAGVAQA